MCDPPFFHEFLVLCVADGSAYRVERTGVGSNTDAIRLTGCESRDLIEWFEHSRDARMTGRKPSELLSRFEFDFDFDILDVLAICYSIQQGKESSKYTLQRYNCYFFCCTILSILARCVADWESCVKDEHWRLLVYGALGEISRTAPDEVPAMSQEYLVLQLLSALDPSNQEPTQCLIDALRNTFESHSQTYHSFMSALSNLLWWSDWKAAMSSSLGGYIKEAMALCSAKNPTCTLVFDLAAHGNNVVSLGHNTVLIKKLFVQQSISTQHRLIHRNIQQAALTLKKEVHSTQMHYWASSLFATVMTAVISPLLLVNQIKGSGLPGNYDTQSILNLT